MRAILFLQTNSFVCFFLHFVSSHLPTTPLVFLINFCDFVMWCLKKNKKLINKGILDGFLISQTASQTISQK